MNILNNYKEWNYQSGEFYLIQENIKLNYHGGTGHITVHSLDNALLTGKYCTKISLTYNWHEKGSDCLVINYINEVLKGDISKVFSLFPVDPSEEYCTNHKAQYTQNNTLFNIDIYSYPIKAINVFSPLHLDRIKPLTEVPKKMTVKHAIRAIVNNQVKNLVCNGIYTDDYAYDAATNFRQGEKDPIAFAEDLITRPSGWHVWPDSKPMVYNINCHSFNTNEFELCLDGGK